MRTVIGGVDTHAATHHAVVIDQLGRNCGDESFPATAAGYAQMLSWMRTPRPDPRRWRRGLRRGTAPLSPDIFIAVGSP